MIAPSAGIIEMAIDAIRTPSPDLEVILVEQQKQLLSAVPNASDSMVQGYQLGMQAARVLSNGRRNEPF